MRSYFTGYVVVGLVVLGVPTFSTVFATDVERLPGWAKWLLVVPWMASAVWVVAVGIRRDDGIARLTSEAVAQADRRREEAVDASLRGLLHKEREFPSRWDWTVYIYDSDRSVLTPAWPRPDGDQAVKEFSPGIGATGQAWQYETTIVRTGPEVSDATHGLSPEQQEFFKDRRAVVATPIWADDEKFGVLAGICTTPSKDFDTRKEQRHLAAVATAIGTIFKSLPPLR